VIFTVETRVFFDVCFDRHAIQEFGVYVHDESWFLVGRKYGQGQGEVQAGEMSIEDHMSVAIDDGFCHIQSIIL